MRGVIRLNDPTSHGGKVAMAATNSKVIGVSVARKGYRCTCLLPGHGMCVIEEGDHHGKKPGDARGSLAFWSPESLKAEYSLSRGLGANQRWYCKVLTSARIRGPRRRRAGETIHECPDFDQTPSPWLDRRYFYARLWRGASFFLVLECRFTT